VPAGARGLASRSPSPDRANGQAPRCEQVDYYHGERVEDPYRLLEDLGNPETRAWVERQNEVTEAFLAALPHREEIRARLEELWDHPTVGVPFCRGDRWFQYRNSGLQDQAVLWVMASPEGDQARPLLDPNELAGNGAVSVPVIDVSRDGSQLAYATSDAGSDWLTWHFREVWSGRVLPDMLQWCRSGTAAWAPDGAAFYYAATTRPRAGREHLERTGPLRLLRHVLGTEQAADTVVFEAEEHPEWLASLSVSDDGRFAVVTVHVGTAPEARVEVVDLSSPASGRQVLLDGFSCRAEVVGNVGTTFYLVTDDGAERRRLVAVELERPGAASRREVVAESQALLLGARHCGGRLVCHHLEDACSKLSVYELDGRLVQELAVPELASVRCGYDDPAAGLEGQAGSPLVHYETASFTDPGTIWQYDARTGQTRALDRAPTAFAGEGFVTERVLVPASDGAAVPLFLARRRDVVPNGERPVLLYGYGGFDIAVTPDFSKSAAVFMERGGVFATAVLRGGGEYGRSWYDAGRLGNKQRVFDDFCDCARWVVASGWSNASRIAINGASNGGLLVGACLSRHPALFGAAVPEVGVMDMLRFHKFTIGWAWKSDYGDPDDPVGYRWARNYSPLHNLVAGRRYPPTMVMTGDHDDRVVPGHSLKFAAALAAAQHPGGPPVLLRVETSAGHGQGKPTSRAIVERADMLAFVDWAVSASSSLPGK